MCNRLVMRVRTNARGKLVCEADPANPPAPGVVRP
jgi:hypothetical protein